MIDNETKKLESIQHIFIATLLFQNSCLDRLVSENNNMALPTTAVTSLPGWCADPALTQILGGSGPYPMVVLPQTGGYWIDGESKSANLPRLEATTTRRCPSTSPSPPDCCRYQLEGDETAKCYRKHFLGRVSM